MRKTFIRTKDIFNNDDKCLRQKYFDICYRKALKYGIKCEKHITDNGFDLIMAGSKMDFIKYYLSTLLETESKINGVKRLFSIITT